MTPIRKQIIDLARTFDGRIMTQHQVMDLQSTLGSMDDTLDDSEVLMFLKNLSGPPAPSLIISAGPPDVDLLKVRIGKNLEVKVEKAPFSKS